MTADAFLVQSAHGGRLVELDRPHPTICASDDRHGLIVHLRGSAGNQTATSARSTGEPIGTVTAGGRHHALVVTNRTHHDMPRTPDEPLTTLTTGRNHALIMRNLTARNETSGQMATPVTEPVRTLPASSRPSLLLPYNGTGSAKEVTVPLGTQPATERWALCQGTAAWALCPDLLIDEFGYRMLTPPEIAAGMAFPKGYIPTDLGVGVQVKLAGNAVTPPVMRWIISRLVEALGPG